jgi:hypothetical protein
MVMQPLMSINSPAKLPTLKWTWVHVVVVVLLELRIYYGMVVLRKRMGNLLYSLVDHVSMPQEEKLIVLFFFFK